MIRLIDVGQQTSDGEGPRQFAFWNTDPDMFLDYNGSQVWSTLDELKDDLAWHLGTEQAEITIKRLEPLVPDWAKV
jgi:hypothetical protein